MKRTLFLAALSLFAFGCGSAGDPATNSAANPTANPGGNSASNPGTAPVVQTGPPAPPKAGDPTVPSSTDMVELTKNVETIADLKGVGGRSATDVKLWESKEIGGRLQKLMGTEYDVMKKNWNAQTPITIEGDAVMMSGCEQRNCGPNTYFLFADTAKNNINIFHLKDGTVKEYKEKGDITLPQAFSDILEKSIASSK